MKYNKILSMFIFGFIFCVNVVSGQINDGNFKSKTSKGFEGCVIYVVDHSEVKKVVKKLRIRNYPSLALFHNGSKKEVWKADMDGEVDVTNKHIKKAIEDAMSGDVF